MAVSRGGLCAGLNFSYLIVISVKTNRVNDLTCTAVSEKKFSQIAKAHFYIETYLKPSLSFLV